MKRFADLSEQEILALAISSEEEDGRIYDDFAQALKSDYPSSAQVFREMAAEENEHRHRLIGLHQQKFGEHIPLLRRSDVKGFVTRKPAWAVLPRGLDAVRNHAEMMEIETRRFYISAAQRTTDASIRQLLGDLAEAERKHEQVAERATEEHLGSDARDHETQSQRRLFVLQIVQPGLAGLMDGSVSTLAPVFAAAFATMDSWQAFLVGMAAALGAGISMGFAEAISDDGSLTGRGKPLLRGVICGLMTALGGVGHALPFLIPDFWTAFMIAMVVVAIELATIAWIRAHYMDTPIGSATFQVVVGGVLVFLTGIFIGSA